MHTSIDLTRAPKKEHAPVTVFDYLNGALMILLCLICVYPMLYVMFASLSEPNLLAAHSGGLLHPLGFTTKGYELVLSNKNIFTGYYNTIIYVVFGTLIAIMMTLVSAFLVSRNKWQWSAPLMILITVHMFFGGGMIPFYLLIRDMDLINTRWAILLPGALNVWNMVVLKTAMMGVPSSLEESAFIDGANDLQILVRVYVPVIGSAIAVQVILYAVGIWNSWFNASLFLNDRQLFPLQIILREILINSDTQSLGAAESASTDINFYKDLTKYCTIIISTLPIMCIYPFMQKYFVKGMMVGAVKG